MPFTASATVTSRAKLSHSRTARKYRDGDVVARAAGERGLGDRARRGEIRRALGEQPRNALHVGDEVRDPVGDERDALAVGARETQVEELGERPRELLRVAEQERVLRRESVRGAGDERVRVDEAGHLHAL